jgi:hypothetical protein
MDACWARRRPSSRSLTPICSMTKQLLPKMLAEIELGGVELVIDTRYAGMAAQVTGASPVS